MQDYFKNAEQLRKTRLKLKVFPAVANNKKSQPLYISCGRSLKMPAPWNADSISNSIRNADIVVTQSEVAPPGQTVWWCIQIGKKGPCLSLLELLEVTVGLRAGRDNETATAVAQPGLQREPSDAPRAVAQAGLKNASDQQAA